MKQAIIRKMEDRKYVTIPIDVIKILNSRNRDRTRFEENIRSIRDVGLLRPIVVNERYFEKSQCYELVCGEGRYLAYKELGKAEIPAEVINCSRNEAYLCSLVENIARVPPGTMWFAREVKRMRDSNISYAKISTITGKGENYIRDYIRLVEQGEERLIKGVEDGVFPISFAKKVARSDNSSIQDILMDAFDSGIVNSSNFPTVKKLIDNRTKSSKPQQSGVNNNRTPYSGKYSVQQLKRDIMKITKEKEAFVNETEIKENRLLVLWEGLHTVWQDKQAVDLIQSENIGSLPELIKKVDDFMSELKTIGIVEGLEIGGIRGQYFMIDGSSWCRANRKLKGTAVPNFVIWEETDFFNYLDSLLTVLSKSNKDHKHKVKN